MDCLCADSHDSLQWQQILGTLWQEEIWKLTEDYLTCPRLQNSQKSRMNQNSEPNASLTRAHHAKHCQQYSRFWATASGGASGRPSSVQWHLARNQEARMRITALANRSLAARARRRSRTMITSRASPATSLPGTATHASQRWPMSRSGAKCAMPSSGLTEPFQKTYRLTSMSSRRENA